VTAISIGGSSASTRRELFGETYEVGHNDRLGGDRDDDILSNVHRLVHAQIIARNAAEKQAESAINVLI
jgi:hypothetical protein